MGLVLRKDAVVLADPGVQIISKLYRQPVMSVQKLYCAPQECRDTGLRMAECIGDVALLFYLLLCHKLSGSLNSVSLMCSTPPVRTKLSSKENAWRMHSSKLRDLGSRICCQDVPLNHGARRCFRFYVAHNVTDRTQGDVGPAIQKP